MKDSIFNFTKRIHENIERIKYGSHKANLLSRIEDSYQNSSCQFFDSFGIIVQLVLSIICVGLLLFKKYFDPIQRSWKTWFLDFFKLMICEGTKHMLNLLIAYVIGASSGLECEWYLVNIIIGCIIGVALQYSLLKLTTFIINKYSEYKFESGNYLNDKNEICNKEFLIQLSIWWLIVVISKTFTLFFILILYHILENMSLFLLSPFSNPKVKLVIVMIIVPMFFNAIELCLVDLIIQRKTEDTSIDSNSNMNNYCKVSKYNDSTSIDDVNENISFIKDSKSSR